MFMVPSMLHINLGDRDYGTCYSWTETARKYPTLLAKQCRSKEELIECLDRVAGYLIAHGNYAMETILETREREIAPPTEMTIAEIEKALGYRVKIVKEKSIDDTLR